MFNNNIAIPSSFLYELCGCQCFLLAVHLFETYWKNLAACVVEWVIPTSQTLFWISVHDSFSELLFFPLPQIILDECVRITVVWSRGGESCDLPHVYAVIQGSLCSFTGLWEQFDWFGFSLLRYQAHRRTAADTVFFNDPSLILLYVSRVLYYPVCMRSQVVFLCFSHCNDLLRALALTSLSYQIS